MDYRDTQDPIKNPHFFTQFEWEWKSYRDYLKMENRDEHQTRIMDGLKSSINHKVEGIQESLEN